jgi:hypothetical protein
MASPWNIQVLTPDYLIDGKIDPEGGSDRTFSDVYIFQADMAGSGPCTSSVYMAEARFQPAGNLVPPAAASTGWYLSGFNPFLAVMPRDDLSKTFLEKHNKYKSLIPGDLYVGNYLIRGTVWSPSKPDDSLGFMRMYSKVVVQDVTIDCLLPGSTLKGLQAPYAVVRTHLLQCAMPRG